MQNITTNCFDELLHVYFQAIDIYYKEWKVRNNARISKIFKIMSDIILINDKKTDRLDLKITNPWTK